MNLPDHWLTPERVREIAESHPLSGWLWTDKEIVLRREAINEAAPEIAATVLEMAARRCEGNLHGVEAEPHIHWDRGVEACIEGLRQLAKEITDGK